MGADGMNEDWTKYGEIHPKMQNLLDDGVYVPDFSRDANILRKEFDTDQPSEVLAGIEEHDIEIPARDGHMMKAHVWRPETSSNNNHPSLVVMCHAGGFVLGNRFQRELDARLFVKKFGVVVLAADYRRGPGFTFPKATEDAWDALTWAAEHASDLGADPRKGFVLQGQSAGAGIAAGLALMARDERLSPRLTGVILSVPFVLDPEAVPARYANSYRSRDQCLDAPILHKAALDPFKARYKPDPRDWRWSALLHPDGHKDHPPVYFQVCGLDPLRDEGLIYEKVLREQYGVKTGIDVYKGLPHLFWLPFADGLAEESKKALEDFLAGARWVLQGQDAGR